MEGNDVLYPSCPGTAKIWSSIEVVITGTTGNRVYPKRVPRVQIPPAPPKRKPIHLDGFFFLLKKGGFERPLRKHACGMFLGRGKIHDLANAPEWVWA